METLIRYTGRFCTARRNGTLSGFSCPGNIIEHFTLLSERVGELIVGGMNRYQHWIRKEFYCSHCGIVYKPTDSNKLKHTEDEKVLKVMKNSYEMKISRDVSYEEILPLEKENGDRKRLQEDDILIEFREAENSSLLRDVLAVKPQVFLIIKPGNRPVLFDKAGEERRRYKEKIEKVMARGKKMFDAGKRKEAQKYVGKNISGAKFNEKGIGSWPVLSELGVKIEKVKVPKNAVPAEVVKILNTELDVEKYWIPSDAVKLIEKK